MKTRSWMSVFAFMLLVSTYGASPWDSWRHGYIAYEQGEQLQEKGNYTEALESFQNSREHYLEVRKARPDWNRRVIAERIADCDAKIKEVSSRLGGKKQTKKQIVSAASSHSGGTSTQNNVESAVPTADNGEIAKLRQQAILLEAELGVYKKRAAKLGDFEKEIAELVRDKRVASERYALLEQRYKKLREESAAPERELAEAKKRLLQEKMRSEAAERRLNVAEQRLQESQEESKNNKFARNAEEKLRKKTEEEVARLKKQYEDLSADLNRKNAAAATDNEKKSEQLSTLQSSLQKTEERLTELAADNQRMKNELARLETARKADKSSEMLLSAKDALKKAEQKIADLTADNWKLKSDMKAAETAKEAIRQDAAQEHSDYEKKTAAMLSSLSESLKKANDRIAELTADNQKLRDNLNSAERAKVTAQQTTSQDKQKTTAMLSSLDESLKKANDRIAELTADNQKLRKDLKIAENIKDTLAQQNSKDLADNEQKTAFVLSSLRESLEKANSQIAELTADNQKLRNSLNSTELANIAVQQTASQNKQKMTAMLSSLDESLKKANDRIAELTADNQKLRNNLNSAERAYAVAQQTASQDKQKTEKTLSALRESLKSANDQVAALTADNQKLKKSLDVYDAEKKADKSSEKIAALNAVLQKADGKIAELTADNQKLKKSLDVYDAEKKADKSAEMLSAMTATLQKTNSRLVKLEEDNQRLTKENSSVAEDARLSKAEAVRYRERNSALEGDVKKLFERNETLTKRLAARDSEEFKAAAAAKEERGKLEQQLLNLQNELVKYRAEADAKKDKSGELERKNKALDAELLATRTKLAVETKRASDAVAENERFRDMASKYEELERNFKALAAENRENKALAAAAKPREAELEKIKIRLLETDRLRADLAKEQRLNEELQKEHLRTAADLRAVRAQLKELDSLRRRNAELEPVLREVERLKKIQSAYQQLQGHEAELSALKIKCAELENQLRVAQEAQNSAAAENVSLKKRNATLESDVSALSRLQKINAELKSMSQSQTAEIDQLNAAMTRQKQELENQRKAEVGKAVEDTTAKMTAKHRAEMQEKEKIQRDALRKAGEESASLEREKQRLSARVDELQSALKGQKDAQTIQEMLQNAQKRASEENRKLQEEIDRLRKTAAASEEKIQQIQKEKLLIAELLKQANSVIKEQSEQQGTLKNAQSQADAKIASLHKQINQLQDELSRVNQQLRNNLALFRRQLDEAEKRSGNAEKRIQLKDEEIAGLRKLNRELADYRNNSADKIQRQAQDSTRIRLEEELNALTKLNAKLSAERDRLLNQLEAVRNGVVDTNVLPSKTSPEEFSASGIVAERHGNTELALWNYRQALAASPNFTPAHQRIGIILSSRGDYKAALPHLSTAYAASMDNLELAYLTAHCQIALKRYGSAKAIIDPLMKKQPNAWQVQLLCGMIEAGTGRTAVAEEKMLLASRLKPEAPEIQLELARLLAFSISDRSSEAVLAYEKARMLGAPPDPELEKQLGSLLDHRRELIRFLSGAAGEAEFGSDWGAAVWYYKKLIDMKRFEFVPRMALAQFRQGKVSAARETLEFNTPSRLGMAVASLIDLESGNTEGALRNAGQAAGAKLPNDWVAMKLELEKLAKGKRTPAVKALLAAFQR